MYNFVRQHLSNNGKHLTSTLSLEICSQIKERLEEGEHNQSADIF